MSFEGLDFSDVTPRPRPSPHRSSLQGRPKPYVPDLSEMGSVCGEGGSGIHASCSQYQCKQMTGQAQEISPPCLCRKRDKPANSDQKNVLELFGNALKAIINSCDESSELESFGSIEVPRDASQFDTSYASKNPVNLDSFQMPTLLNCSSVDTSRNEVSVCRRAPRQLCALDSDDDENENNEMLNDELNGNESHFTVGGDSLLNPPFQLDAKDCSNSISSLSTYKEASANFESSKFCYEEFLNSLENILKPAHKELQSRQSSSNDLKTYDESTYELPTLDDRTSRNDFDSSHLNPRIEHKQKSGYHRTDESYQIKRLKEKYLKQKTTCKTEVTKCAGDKPVLQSQSDPASRFLSFASKEYLKKYRLLPEHSCVLQNENVNFKDEMSYATRQYLERHKRAERKSTKRNESSSKHTREQLFQ